MIVIGIDPGLATVGFGVIRTENRNITPISYGCIKTSPDKQTPQRLLDIFNEITSLFEKYKPEVIAVETLFFSKNVTNGLSISEARGVIFLAAAQHSIPIFEYTPNQVKQAITGSGKADKKQMQEMIKRLLDLDEIPKSDDAADGLSIALCHINWQK